MKQIEIYSKKNVAVSFEKSNYLTLGERSEDFEGNTIITCDRPGKIIQSWKYKTNNSTIEFDIMVGKKYAGDIEIISMIAFLRRNCGIKKMDNLRNKEARIG